MHIVRIELENIKSHALSTYEFSRGTTAISGRNGAGKTTLIEAVAWALFDVLDYKKDDFVSRGAKRGSVRVTFESGLDEREYVVYRDTATGYYAYDPRLKMRIADKKDEVCRFLWKHLGVEPGTDLKSLFRQAIGVPQGTMTSDFAKTPEQRKPIFDKLLRVEEYRRGADELLKTSRYIDQMLTAVRERIARAEGELSMSDAYESEHKLAMEQAASIKEQYAASEKELVVKRSEVDELNAAEVAVRDARSALDKIDAEVSRAKIVACQCEVNLKQGREAAAIVERVKADAERHTRSVLRHSELERERAQRERLRVQSAKVESAIAMVLADQVRATADLEKALSAHSKIDELSRACEEEHRLTAEIESLRNELAHVRAVERQINSVDVKIGRLRDIYRANQAQLQEAIAKSATADCVESLQLRDAALVQQLAHLQAGLERDERFQKEIQNGLCPILSQKCLNLSEGETLEAFVSSQFTVLRAKIAALQAEQAGVSATLKISRDAEKYAATLGTLRAREAEISAEGKGLAAERATLETELKKIATLETASYKAETALKSLDSPIARSAMLRKEAAREPELRGSITNIESNLERLRADLRILAEQLESYKDLDQQLADATAIRGSTEAPYRLFIANEAAAATLAQREEGFTAATREVETLAAQQTSAGEQWDNKAKAHDPDRHVAVRAELLELQTRMAETRAILTNTRTRVDALSAELKRLSEIRTVMVGEFKEKERLEKVGDVTTFIRDTLKDAAPLVARNYVHHISHEANQMFRDVTGNAEHTLKWGEDYGIQLEVDGYDRPFTNLSGGEQMAAALSVRLSLLRQLSDIRVAFFDEPTTNMDAERRENLAMEIGKIQHFDQLFVISHDDTFEGYLDHEIRIGD